MSPDPLFCHVPFGSVPRFNGILPVCFKSIGSEMCFKEHIFNAGVLHSERSWTSPAVDSVGAHLYLKLNIWSSVLSSCVAEGTETTCQRSPQLGAHPRAQDAGRAALRSPPRLRSRCRPSVPGYPSHPSWGTTGTGPASCPQPDDLSLGAPSQPPVNTVPALSASLDCPRSTT